MEKLKLSFDVKYNNANNSDNVIRQLKQIRLDYDSFYYARLNIFTNDGYTLLEVKTEKEHLEIGNEKRSSISNASHCALKFMNFFNNLMPNHRVTTDELYRDTARRNAFLKCLDTPMSNLDKLFDYANLYNNHISRNDPIALICSINGKITMVNVLNISEISIFGNEEADNINKFIIKMKNNEVLIFRTIADQCVLDRMFDIID